MQSHTTQRIAAIGGALLLALALSAAVAVGQTSGAPTSGASYVPPTDSISGQTMLELIAQASRDGIRQSQAALGSTRNVPVRNFAETMVSDQTASLSSATTLWDRLGYTRADTTTTFNGTGISDSGRGLGAGAFPATPADASADRGYVSAQIASQQALLTQLQQKERLVSDPQVRSFATDFRVAVEQHLAAARALETTMNRTAP